MPAAASQTWIADSASSRSASSRVNIGGMCWTMTIGTGNDAGSVGRIAASAFGPPVDTPMATIPIATPGDARRGRGERADLRHELLAHALQAGQDAADVGRLGDVVRGAVAQRRHGGGRAA